MNNKFLKKISFALAIALSAAAFGVFSTACGGNGKNNSADSSPTANFPTRPLSGETKSLTAKLTATAVSKGNANAFTADNLGFSMDFFKHAFGKRNSQTENVLTSPLSAAIVLAMIGNGANGDTLTEMQSTLGATMGAVNENLSAYMAYLQSLNGKKSTLTLADSLWLRESMQNSVNSDFLQKNKNYYDAEIFSSPFTVQTHKDMNAWIENKTAGMIKNMMDEEEAPNEDSFMYLVNALYFAGKWEKTYSDSAVFNGDFTSADGKVSQTKMMRSEEAIYLKDENSKGFIKPYDDSRLAFAAILPDENLSLDEYMATMSATKWKNLFSSRTQETVECVLPAFEYEFEFNANKILSDMGMPSAFLPEKADFSNMVSSGYHAWIGRIFQKTKIEVSEKGTKAAAVTVGEMAAECAPIDLKYVYLDRPFLYAIIDTVNDYPLFIGALTSPALTQA